MSENEFQRAQTQHAVFWQMLARYSRGRCNQFTEHWQACGMGRVQLRRWMCNCLEAPSIPLAPLIQQYCRYRCPPIAASGQNKSRLMAECVHHPQPALGHEKVRLADLNDNRASMTDNQPATSDPLNAKGYESTPTAASSAWLFLGFSAACRAPGRGRHLQRLALRDRGVELTAIGELGRHSHSIKVLCGSAD